MKLKINVTQPFLPPLNEFIPYLERIWDNKIITNGGEFHQQLEMELCEYLGVNHISLFTNGTLALVTALQALKITGEVITTPFSFVATSHSLLWNGIEPVFVDIDPETLNLDPNKIEAAITSRTTAIMPVHCYGQPCDVEAIKNIADKYNLKIIYDAAHAFGVNCHCGSVLNHGDLSVLSFHATKVFNTFEGGAIISPNKETKQHIDHLKNFGFVNEVTVVAPGINGKMSEINSAFGLLQLKYIKQAMSRRKSICKSYYNELYKIKGIRCLINPEISAANNSYFPILIGPQFPITRDQLYDVFKDSGINVRRYFYPLISEFPMYRSLSSSDSRNLPVATVAASQVICLPIHPELTISEINNVLKIIKGVISQCR